MDQPRKMRPQAGSSEPEHKPSLLTGMEEPRKMRPQAGSSEPEHERSQRPGTTGSSNKSGKDKSQKKK